jgi:hypothetical protein
MALDGILFKDGYVRVKRPGRESIPNPSFSLMSKRDNTIKAIDMEVAHIEMGINLQFERGNNLLQLCTLKGNILE